MSNLTVKVTDEGPFVTVASSARLLSAMHQLPSSLANTLKGSNFLDATYIWVPRCREPKKRLAVAKYSMWVQGGSKIVLEVAENSS